MTNAKSANVSVSISSRVKVENMRNGVPILNTIEVTELVSNGFPKRDQINPIDTPKKTGMIMVNSCVSIGTFCNRIRHSSSYELEKKSTQNFYSTLTIRKIFVVPGVPNGTPAVTINCCPFTTKPSFSETSIALSTTLSNLSK